MCEVDDREFNRLLDRCLMDYDELLNRLADIKREYKNEKSRDKVSG